MPNRSYSFVSFAGVLILAMACSGDNPAGPGAPSQINSASAPLSSAIKSDIAATAGNAIASDLETLVVNQAAAVGSFTVVLASPAPSFDGQSSSQEASTTPPPNCTSGGQPGVFLCLKEPGPGDHLKCAYSDERKLYVCVKQEEQTSSQPGAESCSFNAAALIYSCVKSGEGKSVVKSYQFLDASGNPMEKFVKGATESIHYLVKTD